jgi:hypothetical protein
MSSLQQNWRKGQNTFCLEVREVRRREREGRNDPNNVCTYEKVNKEKRKTLAGAKKLKIVGWINKRETIIDRFD